jgi:tetratricopeptide (TPR) repeat protein
MTPTDTRPVEATPRPAPKRNLVFATVAAVGLVAVAAAVLLNRDTAALADDRVLVGVFVNETGDPSQDPLGKVIADWLSRGLHETGLVEVIDERNVSAGAGDGVGGEAGTSRLRALARETGAGLIVIGNYYLTGDSLQLQGQILDSRDGSIIRAMGPLTASINSPQTAIGQLRDRMMGALANVVDPHFGAIAPGISPPKYDAYQEFVAGDEASGEGRWAEAIQYLEAAYRLDTTFVTAAVRAAVAYQNMGRCESVDSIHVSLGARLNLIAPYERYYLERIVARCHADYQEHLRAAEEMMRRAPKSPFAKYLAGRSALWVNQVRYGLELMEELDPDQGELRVYYHFVKDDIAGAYHMLGDYAGELSVVEGWERGTENPRKLRGQVRALAGLGRFEAAVTAAEQATSRAGAPPYWAADIVCLAGLELRTHGGPEQSSEMLENCVGTLQRRGVVDGDSTGYASRLANALYGLERLDDAESTYQLLRRLNPNSLTSLGRLGIIAAIEKRTDEAVAFARELAEIDRPYVGGGPTFWRAKIAAALGDREDAVSLFRQAVAEGLSFWTRNFGSPFHVDIDLEPLRGYAPFDEILKPEG